MANILEVTAGGYYSCYARGISRRALENQRLSEEIKEIFKASRETYGRYRIYNELKKAGEVCSIKRIGRLMKANGLIAKATRRFKVTTKAKSDAVAAPNKHAQDFTSSRPNEKWVSDITYLYTSAGWLYLAVAMALFCTAAFHFDTREEAMTIIFHQKIYKYSIKL